MTILLDEIAIDLDALARRIVPSGEADREAAWFGVDFRVVRIVDDGVAVGRPAVARAGLEVAVKNLSRPLRAPRQLAARVDLCPLPARHVAEKRESLSLS